MDAKQAILESFRVLARNGQRCCLHTVPVKAEKILLEHSEGSLSASEASRQIEASLEEMAASEQIEIHAEPWKDWTIAKLPKNATPDDTRAHSPDVLQWEKYGVDAIEADLIAGGFRLVGGPPQLRERAWAWVREEKAKRERSRERQSAAPQETHDPGETMRFTDALTLKPSFMGMSIDIKVLGQWLVSRFKRNRHQ